MDFKFIKRKVDLDQNDVIKQMSSKSRHCLGVDLI